MPGWRRGGAGARDGDEGKAASTKGEASSFLVLRLRCVELLALGVVPRAGGAAGGRDGAEWDGWDGGMDCRCRC